MLALGLINEAVSIAKAGGGIKRGKGIDKFLQWDWALSVDVFGAIWNEELKSLSDRRSTVKQSGNP